MSNVIPIKLPTTEGRVRMTKVYARGEVKPNGECQWAFNLEVGGNSKGYAFGTRKDAIKARVLIRKQLQEQGLKILS